jgi:hypothetical protein
MLFQQKIQHFGTERAPTPTDPAASAPGNPDLAANHVIGITADSPDGTNKNSSPETSGKGFRLRLGALQVSCERRNRDIATVNFPNASGNGLPSRTAAVADSRLVNATLPLAI